MKRIYLPLLLLCLAGTAVAQTDTVMTDTLHLAILDAMQENVTVYADSAIHRLVQDKIEGIARKKKQTKGYRVQIYSSNNQQAAKAEAFNIEKQVSEAGVTAETYVLYNPPFWKVRLGNFRSPKEANLLKEEIIRLFPSLRGDTYVVRDQIEIIE